MAPARRNAGANPLAGADQTILDYSKNLGDMQGGPTGGTFQQSIDAAGFNVAGNVITDTAAIIHQQQVNDAALALQQQRDQTSIALRQMGIGTSGTQQRDTSAGSGGTSTLMLVGVGLAALLMSGVVKMPK